MKPERVTVGLCARFLIRGLWLGSRAAMEQFAKLNPTSTVFAKNAA